MYRQATAGLLVALLSLAVSDIDALAQESGGIIRIGEVDLSSESVPLVSILASPTAYSNKQIRTMGVLGVEQPLDAESPTLALFMTKEHWEHFILGSALSVVLSGPGPFDLLSEMDGKYVIVEGRVDPLEKGHMSVSAAGLIGVNRIELWASER